MITPRAFCELGWIWRTAAPTLDAYVRWANHSLMGSYRHPIYLSSDPKRRALVAETGFQLAARQPRPSMVDAEKHARAALHGLPGSSNDPRPVTGSESWGAFSLAKEITSYADRRPHAPDYMYLVPGCGAVTAATIDIKIGTEIVEIKSVDRPLRNIDFRQILTYSALARACGITVDSLAIINPYRGSNLATTGQKLALEVGASSWDALLSELIDATTQLLPQSGEWG